jgi:uncharacterized protein (TIRG00374 family)
MKKEKCKSLEPEQALRLSKKSSLLAVGMILLNIAVVVLIALIDFGGEKRSPLSDLPGILRQDNRYIYLIVACGLVVLNILLDSLKNTIAVRASARQTNFAVGYKVGAIGHYYDNITPFAVGGQPFQVHYLTQKKLSAHEALGAVMLTFFLQQLVFVLISPYFLFRGMLLTDTPAVVKVFMWIGYGFFTCIPSMVVLMTFKPPVAMAIVNFFLRVLKKLRILKNTDKLSARITGSLNSYRSTILSFWKHKLSLIVVFLMSVIQYAIYFSIPYVVCRALGASAADTVNLFSQMVMIHFAITIVPTPGNSIAAEFSFYAVFLSALGSFVFFGVLLWRILIFYIYLLQGLIIIIVRSINNAVKAKRLYRAHMQGAGGGAVVGNGDGNEPDNTDAAETHDANEDNEDEASTADGNASDNFVIDVAKADTDGSAAGNRNEADANGAAAKKMNWGEYGERRGGGK